MANNLSKPTVSIKWLLGAAEFFEQGAEEALPTWIVLGLTHRYAENMSKAAVFRRAAQMKSISERRQFLRANGIAA
jgi:hypothetical protein